MNVLDFENLTKEWLPWSRTLLGSLATDGGLPELRERVGEDITIEGFIEHAVITLSVQIAESFVSSLQWDYVATDKKPLLAMSLFAGMRFGKDKSDRVKGLEKNGKLTSYLIRGEDGKYLVFDSILLKGTRFESPDAMQEYLDKENSA
jgi:hypothetical protein